MKTRITVTIEDTLKAAIADEATANRRDLSAEICVLVEEALREREWKPKAPRK